MTDHTVRIFLMNDSVDIARDSNKKPLEYDQDLSRIFRDLIAKDLRARVCDTSIA
nr:DsrE family protein [uncultured Sphaerochaeta sp.]